MDSSSLSSSNENNNMGYSDFYDIGYGSSLVFDGMSETSTEDFFSFYDNNSTATDSVFGECDNFSVDSRFYEDTDSSIDDDRTGSYTTTSRSTPDSSIKSSSIGTKGSLNVLHRVPRPSGSGILKTSKTNLSDSESTQQLCETKITHETIEKLRETELEDVLQYARDIIKPDPKAKLTYCTQPAKVVEGSFRHMLSIKELYSKTGAFKYRTITIMRNDDEEIGISVRKGDGWEKDNGIYISRVSLGSVFDQYEILRVGDEIVQVNKVDVKNMSADDVIRLMHIPDKLMITVKMLTPFSKKRVEQSNIDALKFKKFTNGFQTHKYLPSVSKTESSYKVAQLQIGNEKRNNAYNRQQKSRIRFKDIESNNIPFSNYNNKETNREQQKTMKISPYRTMEGGRPVPTKQCLSPIREFSMSSGDSPPPRLQRKQSYVRWFDES